MRVLVLGSLPNHVVGGGQPVLASHAPLFEAGRVLGWALASKGCRAIVGSASPRTIDPYVVQGYVDYCHENPDSEAHLELQFPDGENRLPEYRSYDKRPSNLHVLAFENHADSSSPHRWIVSHFRALRLADALLTIGGGVSTRLVGSYAASCQIPVLALNEYGGSSTEIYQLARHTYREAVPVLGDTPTREAAGQVVSFLRSLTDSGSHRTHSYFISYSWANCSTADTLEVLLRRFDRMIFRDEGRVKIGQRLPDQLAASIEVADTFVALWSERYRDSDWCPSELDYAIASKARSGRPSRIAVVELDDTLPPLLATSLLRIKADSPHPLEARDSLELGVRRMIEQED